MFGGFIYFTTGNVPGPQARSAGPTRRLELNSNFITTAAAWPFGIAVDGAALSRPARPVAGAVAGPRPLVRRRAP